MKKSPGGFQDTKPREVMYFLKERTEWGINQNFDTKYSRPREVLVPLDFTLVEQCRISCSIWDIKEEQLQTKMFEHFKIMD